MNKTLLNTYLGLDEEDPILPLHKTLRGEKRDPERLWSLYNKFNDGTFLIKEKIDEDIE